MIVNNKMNERKCPETRIDLEGLVMGLTDSRYDERPKKPENPSPESKRYLYDRFVGPNYEDDLEVYNCLLKWGSNREKAIRNYMVHFHNPKTLQYCEKCLENYRGSLCTQSLDIIFYGIEGYEDIRELTLERYHELGSKENLSLEESNEFQNYRTKLSNILKKLHSEQLGKFGITIPDIRSDLKLFPLN